MSHAEVALATDSAAFERAGVAPSRADVEPHPSDEARAGREPRATISPRAPEESMDFQYDLRDFTGQCRLFPLPDLVCFPHALLPLHIFEPRYREMTEDALAGDHLVTMVQIRPAPGGTPSLEAVPVANVGCLGRIVKHERLPDGRFNFLLHGCSRVRLIRAIPKPKLYRVWEAELLEDEESDEPAEPRRGELIALFRQVFESQHAPDDDLTALLDSAVQLGVLSDLIAHALQLSPALKQRLLAQPNVHKRVETLRKSLRRMVSEIQASRVFPPPFSLN
jgi:Lon protease-like protein